MKRTIPSVIITVSATVMLLIVIILASWSLGRSSTTRSVAKTVDEYSQEFVNEFLKVAKVNDKHSEPVD